MKIIILSRIWSKKNIPNIDNIQPQPNTWEENGVHWTRDDEGNLSYYDQESQTWKPYL